METLPTPLDALAEGIDEFRIAEPHEVAAMLQRLVAGDVPLTLCGVGEQVAAATLWSCDAARGTIGFAVDADDPELAAVLESRRVVAVGYLDNVKVQFEAEGLVLVRGARSSTATCAHPDEIYRFQRRNAYRVRPPARMAPTVQLRPADPLGAVLPALRLLDVSIGGCALLLPADAPEVQVGSRLDQVGLELDEATRLTLDLRVQNILPLSDDLAGVRLGCEFMRPDATTQRLLQRFIDQAQKRGRLVTLD